MHKNVHNIVNKIVFMDTFVLIFLLYSFVFIKMNKKNLSIRHRQMRLLNGIITKKKREL